VHGPRPNGPPDSIVGEDRGEVLFGKGFLDGLTTRVLSVGDRVEFQEVSVPGKSGLPCSINHRCDPVVRCSLCARSRDGERDDAELAWWDFLLAVQAVCRQSRCCEFVFISLRGDSGRGYGDKFMLLGGNILAS